MVNSFSACHSSNKADWQTPLWLFSRLNTEFGFTLDAAASAENALCVEHYSESGWCGLRSPWTGHVVWCNPPYGRSSVPRWLAKGAHEAKTNGVTSVLLLSTMTLTTRGMTACWDSISEIRIIQGRLKFIGAMGAAPFGSMLVIFRPGHEGGIKLTRLENETKKQSK